MPPWYFDALSHSLCGLAPASSVWATEWRVYSTADDVPVNSTHLLQNLEKNFFLEPNFFFFFLFYRLSFSAMGMTLWELLDVCLKEPQTLEGKSCLKLLCFPQLLLAFMEKYFRCAQVSLCAVVAGLREAPAKPPLQGLPWKPYITMGIISLVSDARRLISRFLFFFGYTRKKKSKIPKFCFWDRIVPWRSRIIALEGVIVVVAAKRSFLVPFITAYCTERRKGEIWLVAVIRKNSCFFLKRRTELLPLSHLLKSHGNSITPLYRCLLLFHY